MGWEWPPSEAYEAVCKEVVVAMQHIMMDWLVGWCRFFIDTQNVMSLLFTNVHHTWLPSRIMQ